MTGTMQVKPNDNDGDVAVKGRTSRTGKIWFFLFVFGLCGLPMADALTSSSFRPTMTAARGISSSTLTTFMGKGRPLSLVRQDAAATTLTRRTFSTALCMTSPMFHMGHSHAHTHHDHHDHDEDHSEFAGMSPGQKANALRRRRQRRWALWLFCALATLGPKVLKHRNRGLLAALSTLQKGEWLTFGVSIFAISSADKVRRNMLQYLQKLRGLGDAIVKHSSIRQKTNKTQSTTASTISALASQQWQQQEVAMPSAGLPDTSDADRVTWMGVIVNILLSIGKLTVGITQHSSVLIADAGHSLSDLVSDFITLWSVQIARLPPDEDHPYGHTKFEAIGSLFLSLTLLATGLSVGAMAHKQLMPYLAAGLNGAAATSAAGGALAAAAVTVPGPLALVMAGISIGSKEWLYRITKTVGEKLNSPVVVANAWHHRSDAYSSVLALLSIALSIAGFPAADAAAGLLVAGMIGMTGCDILVESIQQLSDSAHLGLQEELQSLVQDWVETDPDVLKITTIRARQVGSSAFCDVAVETSPELSTTATRAVEERLKRYIVPTLSERTGHWITATVHAKPPLVGCPLLEATGPSHETAADERNGKSFATSAHTTEDMDVAKETSLQPDTNSLVSELSSNQVECRVRQQVLLLDPQQKQKYCVQSVTVHYASPKSVSVDVTIHPDREESAMVNLSQLQASAKELQTTLQDEVTEIRSARIYLDLLRGSETSTRLTGEQSSVPSRASATTMSRTKPAATATTLQATANNDNDNDNDDSSVNYPEQVDPSAILPPSHTAAFRPIWDVGAKNSTSVDNNLLSP